MYSKYTLLMYLFIIFQIYDPEHDRYEPPYPEVPVLQNNPDIKNPLISDYIVELAENQVGFIILRKSDNATMYVNLQFVWLTDYLNFLTYLKNKYVYTQI